jgi:hypothetical protein
MKKVAVIGASGNMGKRYALILEKYCHCEVVRIDIDTHSKIDDLVSCDGIIIATPTENHIDDILHYAQWKKPILCEKPISKSILKLRCLLAVPDLDLSMINQYHFLDSNGEGQTIYNYFKTGSDSLYWDCINIIGTARSIYEIKNDSLVWKCYLNGRGIGISEMDSAYIDNIVCWVNGWRNKDYILPTHQKVLEAINAQKG